MRKEFKKQFIIGKVMAYGEKCAIARSRGEKLPRPNRVIDLVLYKYQISDSVDVIRQELAKEISVFGGSIYYYRGEFAGKPSRRFMVELLQKTGFFQTLNFMETQISEGRYYSTDSQIWIDSPARFA